MNTSGATGVWMMRAKEGTQLDIVRRAQAGDREAFEMLVERHATEVYRLAAAIVGDADARDLTQDTFIRAWLDLRRLRDPAAFGPWLRRICVNRCRNWLRTRVRRGPSTSLDAHPTLSALLPDPKRDFRGAVEARAMLEPALDSLSPDQRTVLALHYSIGLSIAESADVLGIRAGTVKSRLHAGLESLRRAIAPRAGPGAADAPTELLP